MCASEPTAAPSHHTSLAPIAAATAGERVSDFEMKLMDIDGEHLGIPETGECRVRQLCPTSLGLPRSDRIRRGRRCPHRCTTRRAPSPIASPRLAEYKCSVKLPANEFQRIIRDMGVMGDTCACGVWRRARIAGE